jgi:crotonobetainyl-CoA:carnitine CoA-transferase CaiB-like acyl-CoA transferase
MKLVGLRVIDLSSFLPGPFLTMALADHGAEVIKIEQPGEGDPGRHIGLTDGGATVFFRNLNRGKKSLVLDLKVAEQKQLLLELADGADVLVETFRPGVAARLGIGAEVVRERNPKLVYCSISAFGQVGAYGARPAHDLALQAISGSQSLTVGGDGQPAMTAIPIADQLSALHALSAILMALLRRERTGRGDVIDIAMHDAMLAAAANIVGPTFAQDRQPNPRDERNTGGAAFYQIYRTRDDRHLVLAGQEPKFIDNLLGALGRGDLIAPCLKGPGPHQRPVIAFLAEVFRQKTLAEAVAWLAQLDVCFGPINTLPEAFRDANVAARGMVLMDELGRRHIAPVIRFAEEPARPKLGEPALGADTEAVLAELRGQRPRPKPED